jgi:hypothetical protein
MNEEVHVVRSKLGQALKALRQSSKGNGEAVEKNVSEAGALLEIFLPKWKGLAASSLSREDATALARTALDLLARYELLIQRVEARFGALHGVPRGVFECRSYWSNLAEAERAEEPIQKDTPAA